MSTVTTAEGESERARAREREREKNVERLSQHFTDGWREKERERDDIY